MPRNRIQLLCLVVFCISLNSATLLAQSPLSLEEINEKVIQTIHANDKVFNWNEAPIDLLWSGLVQTDSILAVGYKPEGYGDIRVQMHTINPSSEPWLSTKEGLIGDIYNLYTSLEETPLPLGKLLPKGAKESGPYFYIKVGNIEIIEYLRQLPTVRYCEPAGYDGFDRVNRSDEGCDDYSATVSASDYTTISPESIQSWHHQDHQIDTAWPKCNKGKGIWVSLMDTGISDDNPKFNDEFAEGESAGRSIEKNGYYQSDGWDDECGHGTAMGGLILATRGYDDTPAGVAYQANLISNRVTNDVVINASDEIDALSDALYDAGDDSKVSIISMSLGDVFSHGPVEDGVIHAYNNGKLIFAAAGTSTNFTNWFGVIFPADMDETVAVTGAIEGTDFTECDVCHTGSEVDFTVFMQRDATDNKTVSTSDDDINSYYRGYVGGSSAGTATMAGIAALAWANNSDLNRDQILNRLIQTASKYPNKDDDFGWGAVNACDAVDSTFALPCADALSNEVTMEIFSITFPSVDDGVGSEAEWVVIIEDKSYYFNVPEGGATGNPATYNDPSVCDSAPIIIDLGNTICGTSVIQIDVETHEDDGTGSDCEYSSTWDDSQTITIEDVDLGLNSFTQSTSNGDFVFEYLLYCTPTFIAELTDDGPKCPGDLLTLTANPQGATNYVFFLDSNDDGLPDQSEILANGSADSYSSTSLNEGDKLGVEITNADACVDISIVTIDLISPNYTGANTLMGTLTGTADYETNDTIHSVQIIGSSAIVDYDSQQEIEMQIGFEVEQGAQFEAFIDGCNDGGGGQNMNENEEDNSQEN